MTEQNPTHETQETAQEPPEGTEAPQQPQEPQESPQDGQEDDPEDDPEIFPREYVVQLRQQAADARVRARQADALSERLHVELVRATGRLADPTDLAYEAGHLEDVDVLDAAIDELLARKPHLASRRPAGDVGQGATAPEASVDLAGLLRAGA